MHKKTVGISKKNHNESKKKHAIKNSENEKNSGNEEKKHSKN